MLSLEKGMNQVHHILKADQMANITLRMLACINRDVVLHSVRTAYLAAFPEMELKYSFYVFESADGVRA